jgi:hypothetical protein
LKLKQKKPGKGAKSHSNRNIAFATVEEPVSRDALYIPAEKGVAKGTSAIMPELEEAHSHAFKIKT